MVDDGFWAHAGDVNLAVRIFDVGEVDVPRHLTVDADRLNPLENSVAGALQHVSLTFINWLSGILLGILCVLLRGSELEARDSVRAHELLAVVPEREPISLTGQA